MKKIVLFTILASLFFIGCSAPSKKSATVVDSKVEGLEYQCAGEMHFTNKNGTLSCQYFPITFKVGLVKLGVMYKIPNDGIILPQDILDISRDDLTNKDLLKLTILLQSLDEDQNLSNGITITKSSRKKLNEFIDIKEISLAELEAFLEDKLGRVINISQKDAIKHLHKSMRKYNIPIPINIDFNNL